jgi:hypothetical protein
MFAQDPKQPSKREQIAMAVTIAALSALATGLVSWGVEELKQRFGTKPKEQDKKDVS